MNFCRAVLRVGALVFLAGVTGCGNSSGPVTLSVEEKERQIKELKEQNVSEWGGAGKKKK
jgi:hypothetical protein